MRDTRSPSWVMTGIWLALVGGATTMVAAALLLYVPEQKKIFDEFGLQLPVLSRWVIRASGVVVGYWFLLVPLVLVALGGGILLLRHALRLPSVGNVFAAITFALLVAVGLMIPLTMALPMDALRQGLAK